MTRKEAQAAYALANDPQQTFTAVDTGIFDGFGLPEFKPVHVTLRQVAALMRWQALQMNGEWDHTALTEVIELGRARFLILDTVAQQV